MLKSLNRNFAKNPKQYILLILVLLSVIIIISYEPMKESMWLFGGDSESEDEGMTAAEIAAAATAAATAAELERFREEQRVRDLTSGGVVGGGGSTVRGGADGGIALTGGLASQAPYNRVPGQNQFCNTADGVDACGVVGGLAGGAPLFCLSTGTAAERVAHTCQTPTDFVAGCEQKSLTAAAYGAGTKQYCDDMHVGDTEIDLDITTLTTELGGAFHWRRGNHDGSRDGSWMIQPEYNNHAVCCAEESRHSHNWSGIEIVKATNPGTDDFHWHIRFRKHGYFMQVTDEADSFGDGYCRANGHGGGPTTSNVTEFRGADNRWRFKIQKWHATTPGPGDNELDTHYYTFRCKQYPNRFIGLKQWGERTDGLSPLMPTTNVSGAATPLICRFFIWPRTADTPPIPTWWTGRQGKAFNDTEWHDFKLYNQGGTGWNWGQCGDNNAYAAQEKYYAYGGSAADRTKLLLCGSGSIGDIRHHTANQVFQIRREFDGMFSMRHKRDNKYCGLIGSRVVCNLERYHPTDNHHGHDILLHLRKGDGADPDHMCITWAHATTGGTCITFGSNGLSTSYDGNPSQMIIRMSQHW
jgi:hypothetical protein